MAVKKGTRSTRATRTPAETEHEFEEVSESVASKKQLSPNEKSVLAARETELRSRASQLNLETTLQSLTTTGLDLTKAISGISEDLQNAAKVVEELTEAGKLLEKDIEELHGKEVAASAIEDLVANFKTEREALEQQLNTLKKDIEQERRDMLAVWTREQTDHQRAMQERNALLAAERARETEQYAYLKTEDRKRNEIAWQNQMADLKRTNDLKQAELERNWATKTAELDAKEAEFAALKARVDGIPTEIDSAVKKAEAIVGSTVKRDYTHQIEILTKDFAAKETVLNAKVENLTTQLASERLASAKLAEQLVAAQSKVAEIANSALNAASGRQALMEVQGVLATQQGNANKKQ
jgi:chromosome segregation ATPase